MSMATRSPRTQRRWRWTRAQLARLPNDGNRYEVLGGELLVTPQAELRHQRIAIRMSHLLDEYCMRHGLGIVVGPGAVIWRQNELQPDVQVIPIRDPIAPGTRWEDQPFPILVVEVMSPGSRRHDLYTKRDAYLALPVSEYWIVDPDERRVLVFRPGADEPTGDPDVVEWRPQPTAPALTIDVRALLAG